jgi:hypothetical protein
MFLHSLHAVRHLLLLPRMLIEAGQLIVITITKRVIPGAHKCPPRIYSQYVKWVNLFDIVAYRIVLRSSQEII